MSDLDEWPCGLLALDEAGLIRAANGWFEARLGHSPPSLTGQHVSTLLPPVGRIYFDTHIFPLLKLQGFCDEIAVELSARDGARLPVLLNARLSPGAGRRPGRIAMAVTEARERRRYERELLATKRDLEARNRDLDAANAQLAARNADLDRAATGMAAARAEAEAANASKSRYLAHMSHEIRTPLNGVLGMVDLLADTPLDKRQHGMLAIVRDSGWSLIALLNDILDIARIEAGRMPLLRAPFDLVALVDRLAVLHRANAEARGLDVTVVTATGFHAMRVGDATRITQILQNLLGNAIKFTTVGGVTLAVEPDGPEGVRLRVSDTGIGMTEEQLGRLFAPFEQAAPETAQRFGGSGLGMSIAHRLVTLMGGTIQATSTPGRGTAIEVRLTLPCTQAAADSAASPPPAAGTADADRATFPGRRVLVADDNEINRQILCAMLARAQVETVCATDGAEAVARWREGAFDLVFVDVFMPVMDGTEALAVMRREAAARGRPQPCIVAATANVMADQCEAYRAAGFTDVLPKPFRAETLQAILDAHLP